MPHVRTLPVAALFFVPVLLVYGGCSSRSSSLELPPHEAEAFEEPGFRRFLAVSPGQRDVSNRYLSNVRVFAASKVKEGNGGCSGVLIAPRLVLTAGHCVCMRRKVTTPEDTERVRKVTRTRIDAMIDNSGCATDAVVELVSYSLTQDGRVREQADEYRGQVLPHPELLILQDEQEIQILSDADLAVIFLPMPVVGGWRAIKLAEAEVQVNDPIVMVGYGFGESGKSYKDRHSGESNVARITKARSGSVEFEAWADSVRQDGGVSSGIYTGDSGGGCFSKADDAVLVGVATSYAENKLGKRYSVFTSVHSNKKWLEEQIERAAKRGSVAR